MADLFECNIRATYLNQMVQNVLHFSAPDNQFTNAQINDIVKTLFIIQVKALQNEHLLYQTLETRRIAPNANVVTVESLLGFTGDLAGVGAHPVIAAIFTIQTATPGRHGHGRFYMGGVHQESILNGVVEPNAFAAYSTKAGIITTRFGPNATSGINLGVKQQHPSNNFIAMQQLIARSVFGVQRRRNIGVGI